MRSINCLSQAKVGDTVTFRYYGGSTPGNMRTVEVTTVKDNAIIGMDLEIDEFRTFDVCKASDVLLVSEPELATPKAATRLMVVAIHFAVARQELKAKVDSLTGEQLAGIFATHRGGINPRFDTKTGEVIHEVPMSTYLVNGQEMTVEQLKEFVKNLS